MKSGKSLVELATEIQRRAEAKKDYLAPATKLHMLPNTQLLAGPFQGEANDIAHGQIGEYVGIPRAYYERMRNETPELLAGNVNTWLARESSKATRMVRTLDGRVRAFLSDRFRPLENEELAEAILPVLFDQQLEVMSCEITERRLYIKAVDKRMWRDVPTGRRMGDGTHTWFDTVAPAIIVSNSEVGCGRLSIETGVFTKVCTNLAMIGTGFKRQHVGAKAELLGEDVQHLLTDNTKRLTDAAVWSQVRDVVRGAFDAKQFEAVTAKLAEAAEDKIEGNVVEVVNRFAKRNTVGEETKGSILKHLIEGADLTRYGLHSAITRASQDVKDYDEATDLERLGGNVIELPRTDWKALIAA